MVPKVWGGGRCTVTVPGRGAWGSSAVARCLSEWGKGRSAVSTVRLQVEVGNGTVHGTSHSGRGRGNLLCLQYFTVGKGEVTVSTVLLTVGGGDTVSTVPLTVDGVGRVGGVEYCPQYLTVGRVGLLCPQYLSPWEGGESGRGGVLCPQYLSSNGRHRGSCGARSRPLAPGGAGSGRAASCQAHPTASSSL